MFCGAAYPNADTAVLGTDVRTSQSASLYELSIDAPGSAEPGSIFEVHLSFEHADRLPLRSSASALVTGGDLLNQQQQSLTPDAVWKVRAGTTGIVGVILRVSTDYLSETGTVVVTYADTLTKRIPVTEVAPTEEKTVNAESAQQSASWSVAIFVVVAVVLLAAFLWYWRKRR